MDFFCENVACRCHLKMESGNNRLRYEEAHGGKIEVERKQIVRDDGKKFSLCPVCFSAVVMVNSPS